jgi:hypothetical protein
MTNYHETHVGISEYLLMKHVNNENIIKCHTDGYHIVNGVRYYYYIMDMWNSDLCTYMGTEDD